MHQVLKQRHFWNDMHTFLCVLVDMCKPQLMCADYLIYQIETALNPLYSRAYFGKQFSLSLSFILGFIFLSSNGLTQNH